MDRAVHAAAAEQARVGRVDDRVDACSVMSPANGLDHGENASLTGITRDDEPEPEPDDRPPICPACGVTQGIVMTGDDKTAFVCLECGFSDDGSAR